MQEACTHCGTEIPRAPGLEGMCPACLARAAALPEPGAASLPIPGVQILSKVGEGGMGVVYAGVQTDLDRAVAVKVLSPVHVSDPAFVRRFMDEARAAARVSDPNVVGIYDVGRSDGNCYLVMEFVEGESLDKRLKRGPIPWRDALPVMTQTLRALAAIHEQGLLHRDVKPSNIMVDPAGRAKLVDFGLARPARADDGSRLPIGTPKYLSPEQARGEELDARSDLYGLGVTFYEMLSGRNPARGETANALLLWHASPDSFADPLCRAAPGVPAELGCVVDRMIQKSARRRYRSAPAALDALEAAAGTASVRRPPWRLVAAGAVALAAIGTLLLVAMRTCGKKTGPTPAAREPAPPVSEPRPEETASKAEEALRRGEYSLAEELARRLARDFPAKSADLIERIRTARESAVRSPGVFGTPESFLLEFDPEDGVLSEDGETLFLIDLAAGALSAVSLREKKETRRVPLAPEPVRLDRRGGLIFVACKSGCILTLGEKTLEVVRRTDIPDGKPSAVAAPPRDADRVYAADGDRLYVIRTSTGGIVQTLEHAAAVGHAGRPVHVCAHPEGSRVYVWATGDRAPAGCARFEREGREDLSQGIRLHHPGPLSFDPLGEFALWESEITPDQKWTSSRTNFTVMAADFHPDVPWCITFTPSMGTVGIRDLHEWRSRGWLTLKEAYFPPYGSPPRNARPSHRILLHPAATCAALLQVEPVTWSRPAPETRRRVWVIPIRPDVAGGFGRLALVSPAPGPAEAGFPYTYRVRLAGTLADGATVKLEEGPRGMTFDATTSEISWIPDARQVGRHDFRLSLQAKDRPVRRERKLSVEVGLHKVPASPGKEPVNRPWRQFRVSRDSSTVYAWSDSGRAVLLDVASRTARIVEVGQPIHGIVATGGDLLVLTAVDLRAIPLRSGDRMRSIVSLPADLDPRSAILRGGDDPALFFVAGSDRKLFVLPAKPDAKPREIARLPPAFFVWALDASGRTLYGSYDRKLSAMRIDAPEPGLLWRSEVDMTRVDRILCMPDGKRLAIGPHIVSTEDGSVLQSLENATWLPDPDGGILTMWLGEEIRILRDGTFEVLDRFHLGWQVSWAAALPKSGVLVTAYPDSFGILPVDMKPYERK